MRGFSGRNASQREYEFTKLLDTIKKHNVSSYLEIGARHGDSFFEIVRTMPKGSTAVAIDLPESAWGLHNSQVSLQRCVEELKSQGYNTHVFYGNSQHISAINYANTFDNFDMIFIDGDHRYDGVKKDYNNYKHLANKLIAFHDIGEVSYNPRRQMSCEVKLLWDEIKENYEEYKEFIEWEVTGAIMGIGVAILPIKK